MGVIEMRKHLKHRFFNLKWFMLVCLTTIFIIVGGISALLMQAQTVTLDKLGQIKNNSAIYDEKGNKVADLGDYKREVVKLEDINKVNPILPEAFVKVEDVRFREHHGVDYWGIGRALVVNLMSGGKKQGASTITMQVAGNVILENRKKTYTRKIKEIATALNLERHYSKDEILEAYLNYIYFGNSVRGVQMASKIYFGKDVTKDKLTISEIAFLAGLPKAPEGYNPYASKEAYERALKRRAIVLNEMAENNEMKALITEEEKKEALKQPLGTNKKWLALYGKKTDQYQAYKQLVLKELNDRYGIPASDVEIKGYKIITGINKNAQEATEQILKDDRIYKGHQSLDGGSATVNPKTGLLAAIGGGRHYEGLGFRINGELPVQPGSAIKPLTVYAPAIEKTDGELNEYTIVPDVEMTINGYTPRNYDRRYRGNIPMGEVVKHSLNAGTVWLLVNKVGIPYAFETAEKLGLDPDPHDQGIAPLALGGWTKGISPIQLAQAYTALANGGIMTEVHAIKEVRVFENGEEKVILPDKEPKKTRVFSEKTAYYMTRMLQDVVKSGTGRSARLDSGQPVAGKTGTTQYHVAAWFAGYSPQYVTTAMIYNTSKTPAEDQIKDLTGGRYSTTVFKEIMEAALQDREIQYFKRPKGVKDPEKPFQLEAPQVSGVYNADTKTISLNWQDQGPRVKYIVFRSEDGESFIPIRDMEGTSFTDTNIAASGEDGFIDGLFGGMEGKTYYYKITAIDIQTSEQKESEIIPVSVQPIEQSPPVPCDPNNPQPGCIPINPDQGKNRDPGKNPNDRFPDPNDFFGGF